MMCDAYLLKEELVRVDGVPLSESEVILRRWELKGIRDCESRFGVTWAVDEEGASSGAIWNAV